MYHYHSYPKNLLTISIEMISIHRAADRFEAVPPCLDPRPLKRIFTAPLPTVSMMPGRQVPEGSVCRWVPPEKHEKINTCDLTRFNQETLLYLCIVDSC